MKVISVLFFTAALVASWKLVHWQRAVAQSVHVGIQADLKNIITEYVQNNLPESKNLRFEKFWTETVSKNRVKAYFVYSFEDTAENGDDALVAIEGSAGLNKISETPEAVTWSLDELQILDNSVTFSEPIHITAEIKSGNEETEAPTEQPAGQEEH